MKDGSSRRVAVEVMNVTGTIRDCIREQDRLEEIGDLIAGGRTQYGSQTFDQHLMDLVKEDIIDFEVAKAHANNPNDFDLKLRGFGDSKPDMGGSGGYSDSAIERYGS
jgi:twitching motility protein PilT